MGDTPELTAFRACALRTELEWTAEFACSNPLVNRLWDNIGWSMDDNFEDVPTDCPQRDERLGWAGDTAIFSRTACQLRDTYLFYRNWLADLSGEQSAELGVRNPL